MKRINNLYHQICTLENLQKADAIAQTGKSKNYGVKRHNQNQYSNILKLRQQLLDKTYQTSDYSIFTIHEPKERIIYRLPYYPDRIVHHALMNVLEPVFMRMFTADTYSCIKGRGIHALLYKLKSVLKDEANTTYCLKLDIKKFYPSVDHDILKYQLRKKFKDVDLLKLLDEIIDSAPGLPIGNYASQHLANFYLTYFDHWLKEDQGVKYYFRYCDDIVILRGDKDYLHKLRVRITEYLARHLKLEIKDNYQVFPVKARGIDYVGYVFYSSVHIEMRKPIKRRFIRVVKRGASPQTIAAYKGWAKHCNSVNLLRKYGQ